jgi:hypothetical protein
MIKTYCLNNDKYTKTYICIGEGRLSIDETDPHDMPSWVFYDQYNSKEEYLYWNFIEIIRG